MYEQNATIAIAVNDSIPVASDPYTNAPIFNQTLTEIKASIEEAAQPIEVVYSGTDRNYIYVEGRTIDKELPASYQYYQHYPITFTLHRQTTKGVLYTVPTLRSRLGLEKVFGDAIAGFVIFD
jgi:hypothetical protein